MTCVIYGLYCPVAKCIRYIGKAKNPGKRFLQHLMNAKTRPFHHHLSNWIRKIKTQGFDPELRVLLVVPDGEDWENAEQTYIKQYREAGHLLTNMTSGGDGNHDMHPEVLVRMSQIAKQNALNPTRKQQLQNSAKEGWAILRENHDLLTKRNQSISETMLDLWSDPEAKAKRLATLHTEEVKAKRYGNRDTPEKTAIRVAKLKAAWADPEARAKRLAVMRSPEYKAKIAAKGKAAWSDPEAKARRAATMRTAEVRAKNSEAQKAAWRRRKLAAQQQPEPA